MIFKILAKSNFPDVDVLESVYAKYPKLVMTSQPMGIQMGDGGFSSISILFKNLKPTLFVLFFRLTQVEKTKFKNFHK